MNAATCNLEGDSCSSLDPECQGIRNDALPASLCINPSQQKIQELMCDSGSNLIPFNTAITADLDKN
jgi:hypothetical protein